MLPSQRTICSGEDDLAEGAFHEPAKLRDTLGRGRREAQDLDGVGRAANEPYGSRRSICDELRRMR